MSDTSEAVIMVSIICGMVVVIILYAAAYRRLSSEKYHDSLKKAIFHIALTLFTYVLYLFDTLSDVFLCIQYYKIGKYNSFIVVLAFTILPEIFLAAVFHKQIVEGNMTTALERLYIKCVKYDECFTTLFGLLSFISLLAVFYPVMTYAQVLSRGKPDSKLVYTLAYLALIEATVESAPQLTIQIYLLITDTHDVTTQTQILRYVSIVASSIGLAWSLNAFKHQYRKMEQKQEDSFWIKVIHWVSRLAEIGPRIILLALMTAEYSYYVLFFIGYRLLHGLMYVRNKKDMKLDLFLGTIGNLFCFSVSHIYQCQKREQYGGIFFVLYYFLYYAENAVMLCLWYIDTPELLQFKIGGAFSNKTWYTPYIFAVVCVGCVFQLSFLGLYYWCRGKQQTAAPHNSNFTSPEYME